VEAPSSIFSAKLGKGPDADAELLLSGSWSSTLIATLNLQAAPGSKLSLSSAQPLLYTQDPDLALAFLLYKKIFVEARVSQDIAQAKYSAGYRGGKGELLKEAKVGNDGIDFPALPFLSFGQGSYRSFGASALIGTDDFQGKAMIRYDQASRVTKRFVGSTEVTETVIAPNSFVSGKYFLTRGAPATNLEVYVLSSSGTVSGSDGNLYRKLDASEYAYSSMTGVLSLASAAATRVLGSYPGSGALDAVSLDGIGPCDLLFDPPPSDHPSASLDPKLQLLDRYATTAVPSTAIAFVRNPSSGAQDANFQAVIHDGGYVEVTQTGMDASGARAAGAPDAYRQPFGATSSTGMAWIYTTDFASSIKTALAPVFTRNVVVQSFSSSTTITIDKDFVAGSIEVTRNGVPDYAFSVNTDSGLVTFANPPSAADNIVISYLKESYERKTGIIVGALGGFWDLGASRSAWAALGASWSLPGSSYSSGGTTSPGSIGLTAGEKDSGGVFQSDAALVARYSRDDSTGIYRIEGMESTSDYTSSFRPLTDETAASFTDTEIAEKELASVFPSLDGSFHSDGTVQKALQIVAGPAVSNSSSSPNPNPDAARYYKVEDAPSYASFGTFAFCAKLPPGATLSVALDDGSAVATTSVGIVVPADATRSFAWRRYFLHYGKGDATVYVQDGEGGAEKALPGAAATSPALASMGSRLVVSVSGLDAGEVAWVDEVVLEDSVGSVSLAFQGAATYDDPKLLIGRAGSPIVSDMKASAFMQGALDRDSYASGGGSLSAQLGFVGLGMHARAVVSNDLAAFSGGHSIELPAVTFPVKLKDGFDYDPESGAFGRSDSIAIQAGSVASLSLGQTSAWTPPSTLLDKGMLVQSWDGSLGFGPSYVTLGLSVNNRAQPPAEAAPEGAGNDYAAAWLGAFEYALPAFESDSDLRDAKATLSVKDGGSREFLAVTLAESAMPAASVSGLRNDTASLRLAAPFSALGISLEPYYSRTWKEQVDLCAGGIFGDVEAALGDVASMPLIYRGIPFGELSSPGTASDFATQSAPSGIGLPAASYEPKAGIKLAREYGSSWYDLVAPSAIDFSYGRDLSRASDTVTDLSVFSTSAKIAAINIFGAMGSFPLGLPFDSDEYLTTVQADLSEPRDGSASSFDLLYHGLATLYAGQADRLDTESKLSIAQLPSSMNWSGSLSIALSRRLARHWLLDLYRLAIKPAAPEAEGAGKEASIALLYLSDLKTREPNVRSTWTLVGGLSGLRSDATAYLPGWSLAESYEAKLTVPERLTFKVDASLNQSLDASTRVFALGFSLSLNAVISF
jgi:hypothetical protein